MNFFISDLHFGHENCLDFDDRPFLDIDEHDTALINRWNNVVSPEDDVYILGDISWKNTTATINILDMLNGSKHLIVGNHDHKFLKSADFRSRFIEICDYKELYIDKNKSVVLSHFPIFSYRNLFRGWIHLYGHVHKSFDWNMMEHHKKLMKNLYSKKDGILAEDVYNAFNVGCMIDYMDYTPKTLEEILEANNCSNTF